MDGSRGERGVLRRREVPVENRVHEEGKGWTVAKYCSVTNA